MRFLITLSIVFLISKYVNAENEISKKLCSDGNPKLTFQLLNFKLNSAIAGNEKTAHYLQDLNERYINKTQYIVDEIEKTKNEILSLKKIENIKLNIRKQSELTNETLIYLKNKNIIAMEHTNEECVNLSHDTITVEKGDDSWTVIQRREDGSVDFYRNWDDYKHGFGNEDGELFAGLDKIHNLTNGEPHELVIILEDFDGNIKYAEYDDFLIGSEEEKYQLKSLGNYRGNAGDHLRQHLYSFFSTKDRDNDKAPDGSCAQWFQGAWWYKICMTSNLNGPYRTSPNLFGKMRGVGITWGDFYEIQYAFRFSEMLIHSKNGLTYRK